MNTMLLILMLPMMFIERMYKVFTDKDFPVSGTGLVFIGLPIGIVCWIVILYGLLSHVRIV